MLNVSCHSGTQPAPARPATRSTEERAFAPPPSGVSASPTGSRPARYLFRHAAPSPPDTLSRDIHTTDCAVPGTRSSRRRSAFAFAATLQSSAWRPLSTLVSRSALATIAPSGPAFPHLVRSVNPTRLLAHRTQRLPRLSGIGVRAGFVSHFHARRRSNPGMQRTRYARR